MTLKCIAYTIAVAWGYMTFLPSAASAPVTLLDAEALYDFTREHNDFVRAYFGCPKDTTEVSEKTCSPHAATLDLRQYARVRKLAAKLYHLNENDPKAD